VRSARTGADRPARCGRIEQDRAAHSAGSTASKGGSNSSWISNMTSEGSSGESQPATIPSVRQPALSIDSWPPRPPKGGLATPSLHSLFTGDPAYGMKGDRLTPDTSCHVQNPAREDDLDMRRFLVKALQNAGFDVTSYDNGLSAYQRLREEPFELLLTDIVMRRWMDRACPPAAELDPDIKIMFITGFAAVALNSDSSAPKHAKVLSKPIHLRELVTEVQKLLAPDGELTCRLRSALAPMTRGRPKAAPVASSIMLWS